MSKLREKLTPLIEEIAELRNSDPDDIALEDIPDRALDAAAIAYGRGQDYPHLRDFMQKVDELVSPTQTRARTVTRIPKLASMHPEEIENIDRDFEVLE